MRAARAFANFRIELAIKLVTIFLGFYIAPILVRGLGTELYGANQLLMQIMQYLNLAEFGFGAALTTGLYPLLVKRDYAACNRLIAAADQIFKGIGLALLLLGVGGGFWLLRQFQLAPTALDEVQIAFLLYLSGSVASFLFMVPLLVVRADQQYFLIGHFALLSLPLVRLGSVAAVELGWSLPGIAAVTLAVNLAVLALSLYTVRQRYPWMRSRQRDRHYAGLSMTRYVFIDKLMVLGVFHADIILISLLLAVADVTPYALYNLIFITLRDLIWLPLRNVQHSIGDMLHDPTSRPRVQALWQDLVVLLCFAAGFVGLILYRNLQWFMSLWVGDALLLPNWVLLLLLVNLMYLATVHVSTLTLNAAGKFRERVPGSLAELAINVVASVYLIPRYGVGGAILGTTIGHLTVNAWYLPCLAAPVLGMRRRHYLRLMLPMLTILVLIGLPLGLVPPLLGGAPAGAGWLAWLLDCLLSSVAAGLLLLGAFLLLPAGRQAFARLQGHALAWWQRRQGLPA